MLIILVINIGEKHFFQVQERGMRYIDLVKIDVEGAEPLVLQGAKTTFAAQKEP